jgi:dienelactone hydrolase
MQVEFNSGEKVPLRIGIHTGDVIITDDDIIGDSVNLASRVESMGVAGCILISGKVAEDIKSQDDILTEFMGEFHFKNDDKPRKVFAIDYPGIVMPNPSELKGKLETNIKSKLKISKFSVGLMVILLMVVSGAYWLFDRQSKVNWAENEALPQVEELVEMSWRDYTEAYNLAKQAELYIPKNERLQELIQLSSLKIQVNTEPAGASVYFKEYQNPELEWKYLGITPMDSIEVPKGFFRWMMVKEGYDTVLAVESSFTIGEIGKLEKFSLIAPSKFFRKLDKAGTIPERMTRVPGGMTRTGKLPDFFIDKYEVSNKDYKRFVDNGGYTKSEFWTELMKLNNTPVSWKDAVSGFTDKTGRPGPSTWVAGDYPKEKGDYPVGGISWYEAAAYTKYVEKALPTENHWGLARGENKLVTTVPQFGGFALFAPFSNFNNEGPVRVGSMPGMTSFGAYDLAGNVREWCWNDTDFGKLLRGGAWNNNTYSYGSLRQAPGFDRDETNGFRCVIYPNIDSIPKMAFNPLPEDEFVDLDFEINPVSDDIYEVYKNYYDYDRKALDDEVLNHEEDSKDWILEKVAFNTAYAAERMQGYLFLPKNSSPPFQIVVYVPGSASFWTSSSENIEQYYEFPIFLDFIVKTGRAVFYPVYKGTFERQDPSFSIIHDGKDSHEFSEGISQVVKDFRRSIDYLESRDDIDTGNLAYYGMSWGPVYGPIFAAVEDRIKTNVYVSGGLGPNVRPEAHPVNFLSRVKQPTIMINGRYDSIFAFETRIKAMFDLLGTPDEHKKLVLFDTDHIPPRNEMIKEILSWLDKYLEPVKPIAM